MDIWTRREFLLGTGAFAAAMAVRAEAPQPMVRFGVVTDCHYADKANANGWDFQGAKTRLQNEMAVYERHQVDFVIELGDFKDNSGFAAATLAKLDEIESVFASFSDGHYHVLGNHDVDCITKDQFLSHITNTGFDTATGYYSFVRGGVTFIVLDCDYASDSDSNHLTNGADDWGNLYVPPAERAWLQSTLAAATGPVVVFSHPRLDPDGGNYTSNNAAAVRQILEASKKVIAVFNGHQHAGARCNYNGINYYTLASQVQSGKAFEVACYANGITLARLG